MLGVDDITYHSQNSARFMLEGFGDTLNWQIHYELSPVFNSVGDVIDNKTLGRGSGTWRLTDIKTDLHKGDNKNTIIQNLDRFNVQWRLARGDITFGRQPISFGAARSVNPTDVFLPFDVRVFSQEYRVGVDALRYQTPLGDLGEFDAGFIWGEDSESSAAFVQLKVNTRGNDLSIVALDFGKQRLLGAGIQRALGGFGFWLEGAYASGDQSYWRATTGVDYAFTEKITGMIEYHYNDAGNLEPRRYRSTARTAAYTRGGVYLLAKRYVMPSVSVSISPIWTLTLQSVVNLDDNSAFSSIIAEFNFGENLYSDFGIYLNTGEELDLLGGKFPRVNSEFGSLPSLGFASVRYYF